MISYDNALQEAAQVCQSSKVKGHHSTSSVAGQNTQSICQIISQQTCLEYLVLHMYAYELCVFIGNKTDLI